MDNAIKTNFERECDGFAFEDWLYRNKLTSETGDKLRTVNICSLEAISELELTDLKDLKLPIGDKLLIRREIKRVQELLTNGTKPKTSATQESGDSSSSSDGSQSTSAKTKKSRATTQTLAQDRRLRELLESLKDSSIKDVLALQDCEVPRGEKKRLLLIPDHIFSDVVLQQTEEEIISENASVKTV